MKAINEVGNRYGRLTVVSFSGMGKRTEAKWLCRCDCGKTVIVGGSKLRSGNTKSCGCYAKEIHKKQMQRIAKNCVGEKNHNWKGGRIINGGYVKVMAKGHPRARSDGYVPEHLLIMESILGRHLEQGEVVHHCNGNKTDNRIFNLRLFPSNSEHMKYHMNLKLGTTAGADLESVVVEKKPNANEKEERLYG